jgi:hypothetical protein
MAATTAATTNALAFNSLFFPITFLPAMGTIPASLFW